MTRAVYKGRRVTVLDIQANRAYINDGEYIHWVRLKEIEFLSDD